MRLEGKTCVITGATDGIGLESARAIASMGPRLVIVGRNRSKTEEVCAALAADPGAGEVIAEVADLSSQAEIRSLAERLNGRLDRLDILLNNAGAMFLGRRESVDGIEMTFALNHLGYFLLTNLLIDLIKTSAPARIVNVASAAHYGSKINFEDLNLSEGYSAWRAYQQSKLANVLFTKELARRLEGSGVTATAVHPGVVASRFGHNNNLAARVLLRLARPFMINTKDGADTSIYMATSPEVEGVSGLFYDKRKPREPSAEAKNMADAERLWAISEKMTGLA